MMTQSWKNVPIYRLTMYHHLWSPPHLTDSKVSHLYQTLLCFREAGEYMTAGSKTCISVSTLAEAEFYASAGYDDITYAYPLSPDKIPQASQLLSRLEKFHVLIDNLVVLKALVNNPPKEGKKWSVFLKVDCGYNRGKDDGTFFLLIEMLEVFVIVCATSWSCCWYTTDIHFGTPEYLLGNWT